MYSFPQQPSPQYVVVPPSPQQQLVQLPDGTYAQVTPSPQPLQQLVQFPDGTYAQVTPSPQPLQQLVQLPDGTYAQVAPLPQPLKQLVQLPDGTYAQVTPSSQPLKQVVQLPDGTYAQVTPSPSQPLQRSKETTFLPPAIFDVAPVLDPSMVDEESRTAKPRVPSRYDFSCSYCGAEGHKAYRCMKNPNRGALETAQCAIHGKTRTLVNLRPHSTQQGKFVCIGSNPCLNKWQHHQQDRLPQDVGVNASSLINPYNNPPQDHQQVGAQSMVSF